MTTRNRRPRGRRSGATNLELLAVGRERALELLAHNLTPEGILASSPSAEAHERRYTNVFARDAAICSIAMMLCGDARLREGAKAGLRTLALHQADNGQIPKFVDPRRADSDFWYLGCIDATLWWLVAVRLLLRNSPDARFERETRRATAKALEWLRCQEHPRLLLLQQNEASDWADIMPRSGFVLYTNALWFYVKRLYGLKHAAATRKHANHLFFPFSRDVPGYHRLQLLMHYARREANNRDLYLSFVNFSFWGDEGDVLGNLLAVLLGLADPPRARRIVQTLERADIESPHPARAVLTPLRRRDRLWRAYMERHEQNREHQYHNGGAWPMIGGFWVLALAALGRTARARTALLGLARACAANDWAFQEWFHGRSGAPRGMRGQSWSAAMLLLAEFGLHRRIF
jgi:glycogen debranching enzyme